MIISCENCNKKFELEDHLIPETGRFLQCGSCSHKWHYKPIQKTETIKHRSEEKLTQYEVKANVEIIKSDKPVDTISEISASYDLLILGTPEKDNWIKVLFGGGKDKFTERAACSVLRITLKD